jgi:hypothetical protein
LAENDPLPKLSEDFALVVAAHEPTWALADWRHRLQSAVGDAYRLLLVAGIGASYGQIAGLVIDPAGEVRPLHRLELPGAGMFRFDLQPRLSTGEPGEPYLPDTVERWSRTRGALGIGVWRRFTALHYAVIGCGRTGSLAAADLARCGVRRLTLVDDDFVETSTLGESADLLFPADIGKKKAAALARQLSGQYPHLNVDCIPTSVTRFAALAALKSCDVLVVCVDNGAARLACATIAGLYSKVSLDIGTGIFASPEGRGSPVLGADIRLLLPGDLCLLCHGGILDEGRATQVLSSRESEAGFTAGRDWQRERAGSLHSLNQIAVSMGLRLLEDLVGERVERSTWLQLDYSGTIPVVRRMAPSRVPGCRLCAIAATGDGGLKALPVVRL